MWKTGADARSSTKNIAILKISYKSTKLHIFVKNLKDFRFKHAFMPFCFSQSKSYSLESCPVSCSLSILHVLFPSSLPSYTLLSCIPLLPCILYPPVHYILSQKWWSQDQSCGNVSSMKASPRQVTKIYLILLYHVVTLGCLIYSNHEGKISFYN